MPYEIGEGDRRDRESIIPMLMIFGLLGPKRQAEGWNVLALSNGRWKLPDDQFGAFHYVAVLPR